jgi:hypothetical protein
MDAPVPINPFPPVPAGHYTGPMRLRVNGLPGARIDQERVAELHHIARVMTDQCFAHCRAFGSQQAMRRHIEADGTRIQVNVLACSYPPMVTAWIWTPELPVLEGKPVHINEDQVWIPGLFLVRDYVLEPPTGITPNFCSLVAEQNGWRLFTRPKHPVTGKPLIPEGEHYFSLPTAAGVAMMFYNPADGRTWYAQEGGQPFREADSDAAVWKGGNTRELVKLNEFNGIDWTTGGIGINGEYILEGEYGKIWTSSGEGESAGRVRSYKKSLHEYSETDDRSFTGSRDTKFDGFWEQDGDGCPGPKVCINGAGELYYGTCHSVFRSYTLKYEDRISKSEHYGPYLNLKLDLVNFRDFYKEESYLWISCGLAGGAEFNYENKVEIKGGEYNASSESASPYVSELDFSSFTTGHSSYSCYRNSTPFVWTPTWYEVTCSDMVSTGSFEVRLFGNQVNSHINHNNYAIGTMANITADFCTIIRYSRIWDSSIEENNIYFGVFEESMHQLNVLFSLVEDIYSFFNNKQETFVPLRPYASKAVILPLPQ